MFMLCNAMDIKSCLQVWISSSAMQLSTMLPFIHQHITFNWAVICISHFFGSPLTPSFRKCRSDYAVFLKTSYQNRNIISMAVTYRTKVIKDQPETEVSIQVEYQNGISLKKKKVNNNVRVIFFFLFICNKIFNVLSFPNERGSIMAISITLKVVVRWLHSESRLKKIKLFFFNFFFIFKYFLPKRL